MGPPRRAPLARYGPCVVSENAMDAVQLDRTGEDALYRALRRHWHPVMFADELGEAPKAATLLDEAIVVVRMGGAVSAFRDLCVHRGTALSLGKVLDGELQYA